MIHIALKQGYDRLLNCFDAARCDFQSAPLLGSLQNLTDRSLLQVEDLCEHFGVDYPRRVPIARDQIRDEMAVVDHAVVFQVHILPEVELLTVSRACLKIEESTVRPRLY